MVVRGRNKNLTLFPRKRLILRPSTDAAFRQTTVKFQRNKNGKAHDSLFDLEGFCFYGERELHSSYADYDPD
jgi:hypothetical protein